MSFASSAASSALTAGTCSVRKKWPPGNTRRRNSAVVCSRQRSASATVDVGSASPMSTETGQPTVLEALLVVDVGTIINPVAHRGQLAGGFVFGLGAALMEELRVSDGTVTSGTLGEVKLPTSMDCPPLRIVHVPTPVGPGAFGAKMAGELTNAIVAPAVANAVADAVGARVTSLPLTAERIFLALGAPRRP